LQFEMYKKTKKEVYGLWNTSQSKSHPYLLKMSRQMNNQPNFNSHYTLHLLIFGWLIS